MFQNSHHLQIVARMCTPTLISLFFHNDVYYRLSAITMSLLYLIAKIFVAKKLNDVVEDFMQRILGITL